MTRYITAVVFCLTVVFSRSQVVDTNVWDAYASIGFDPTATNCGVLAQISDIHMIAEPYILPAVGTVTNLDERLVRMIKALSPPPTALIVSGDLATSGAYAAGNTDEEPDTTNELKWAQNALKTFNFPVYKVPGNHDNPAYEATNSPLFNSVFTNTSRYTNFTIAGMPVIALAGHGGGWLDPEERDWLFSQRDKLDHNKQVIVVVHQPVHAAFGTDAREARREIMWFLKPWKAPVWVMSGHAHARDAVTFPVGMTTAWSSVVPAGQNGLIPTQNPWAGSACGFFLWCITNGNVAGVIEGVLTNGMYIGVGPLPINLGHLYDGLTNVLFMTEEGHFDRSQYNMAVKGLDVTFWRSYVYTYTCQLPIAKYPSATRVFLIANTTNSTDIYLGPNTNSLQKVPLEFYTNNVVSAVIPANLRTNPLWMMASNTPANAEFDVGGFGLGTTNAMTDFQAWAGVTVGDSTIQPDTVLTNGIKAWDAYLFGLDATHKETMREQAGYPWLGTWPYISPAFLRFGGRANIQYHVMRADSPAGPWTPVPKTVTMTTNGWNEFIVSNTAPSSFYRITSPAQTNQ